MRMRKKKHGEERIRACAELLIEDPSILKEDPQAPFTDKSRKLCLEIGCGKGNFAVGTAAKDTDCNIIAMERARDVCCLALEKAMAQKETRPDNLRFIIGDADKLEEWFPEHCLEVLYLNFSDPWPKAGHAKRRLTHRNYLAKYKKLLKEGGLLIFKTDNVGLFDFSLEEFSEFGLNVEWITRDLHNSERAEVNVMTEYEKNFSEKGFTINSAIVRF
ncbi:MAG: tRNA (guanosine(46)-N7)-methyltransferase TrmB [Clostridia bacterium]|nr:tRNA (guanosine(46)-N7)-methyltransferase TrmB [Clostridia bacterium]